MKFAVIFDLDGVLIDSTSYIPVLVDKVASSYGLKLPRAELLESTHFPFPVWVGNWNKRYNRSIDVQEVIQKYAAEEHEYLKIHSILYSGVTSLLTELRAKNVLLGVATSAPRKRLDNILSLSKINNFFDATISIDEVTCGKPDPEPYLKTAQALNVPATHCVGIEDTNTGLSSVISAGMKSIGFAAKSENKSSLVKADLIISNFSELNAEKVVALFEK